MAKQISPISDPILSAQSQEQFQRRLENAETMNVLTRGQYAKNTLVSFTNDWNNFLQFCLEQHVSVLPATADTVHRFIEKMADSRKLASLKRYVVTISLVHRCHSLPDPCAKSEIRLAMRKQQTDKHSDQQNAAAFRDKHLQQLLSVYDVATKAKDVRDCAIWAVMFEGMLKRSELAALCVDDLFIHDDGLIDISVGNHTIALSNVSSKALQRWLVIGAIFDDVVFRRIDRHGNVGDKAMDHSSIYRVFRRASSELGLSDNELFSGQSPRVGASKDLADAGLSLSDIQEQGRWKSPAMPAQYIGKSDKHDQEIKKYVKDKPWER